MLSSQFTTLADITILNQKDEQVFEALVSLLENPEVDPKSILAITNAIKQTPLRSLYAMKEKNEKVNQFLETNRDLNYHWADLLKRLKYPFHVINSFDATVSLSLFTQLMGEFLLGEFIKNPDYNNPETRVFLDKACEIGIFHALIMRLNYSAEMITERSSKKMDDSVLEGYIKMTQQDVAKLSNLYWAVGYFDSANILFNLVNYYYAIPEYQEEILKFIPAEPESSHYPWATNYEAPNCPYPIKVLEDTMEHLFMAEMLSSFPQSKRLVDELTHSKELKVRFNRSFIKVDELRQMVMDKLDSLGIANKESFCGIAIKRAREYVKQYHPDAGQRS